MNLSEYQKLAMRTSPTGHDRVKNGCMGLMGESGEIVDVLKKYLFQSGENPEFPADRLTDECGDVLWYCAELMEGLDIPLAAIDAYAPTIPPYVHKLPIESVAQYLVFVSSMLYRIQNFDGVAEDEPDAMPEMRRKKHRPQDGAGGRPGGNPLGALRQQLRGRDAAQYRQAEGEVPGGV